MSPELLEQLWYHGKLSRFEADKLLLKDGDFLVRSSSSKLALSCKWNSLKFHFIIIKDRGSYILDDDSDKYDSVIEMISDFVKNKKEVTRLSKAKLLNPIPNFKPNAKIFKLPLIKTKKGLDLTCIEEIKSEMIGIDSFRFARHIMDYDLHNFKRMDFIMLPAYTSLRKQEIIRDLSFRYFFISLCLLGEVGGCLQVIEKLISTAGELLQTLGSVSGFCSLMKVLTAPLVIESKVFQRFKVEYVSTQVTFYHLLLPAFCKIDQPESDKPLVIPDLITAFVIMDTEDLEKYNLEYMSRILSQVRFALKSKEDIVSSLSKKLENFERMATFREFLSINYHQKLLFGHHYTIITSQSFQLLSSALKNLTK